MKYIDNRINANIVKLEDENNNYTSENVEGALEEIDSKIKNIESQGYDDRLNRGYFDGFVALKVYNSGSIPTSDTPKGAMAYDGTNNKPIWFNGVNWHYADGTSVS